MAVVEPRLTGIVTSCCSLVGLTVWAMHPMLWHAQYLVGWLVGKVLFNTNMKQRWIAQATSDRMSPNQGLLEINRAGETDLPSVGGMSSVRDKQWDPPYRKAPAANFRSPWFRTAISSAKVYFSLLRRIDFTSMTSPSSCSSSLSLFPHALQYSREHNAAMIKQLHVQRRIGSLV